MDGQMNQDQNNRDLYPRVLKEHLADMINKKVTVVGKILPFNNEIQAQPIEVEQGEKIDITNFNFQNEGDEIQYIEIRGTVTNQGQVNAEDYTLYSKKFDIDNYAKMVKLSRTNFKSLFE